MTRFVTVRNFRDTPVSKESDVAYQMFRKLVERKNKNNIILLNLYVINPIDLSGQRHEFCVVSDSFKPKMETLDENEDNEVGFSAKLESPLFPENLTLEVVEIDLEMKLIIQEKLKRKKVAR